MQQIILTVAILILAQTTFLTVRKLREKRLKVARGSLLLDTSAIMDGRIVDVAKSGIITAEIIVPRSVINELQLLADRADHGKRMRARKGLENVRELQKMETVSVTIPNDGHVGSGGVDERLLELAKNYEASIATTDYNLNKVAKVVGITVVNVNELAQMLRVQHLPGETVEIQLIQPGANREQAVGYLDDGTMVVVEDAKNLIGQNQRVEIIRSLQTEAGRMMFAKKVAPSKIKSAPAFHSEQLKNNSQPRKPRFNKNRTNRSKQHNKPTTPEDSMVRLANNRK
ncbi:hypothetical protein FWD20_03440 [Candidatus Saccharibacteria bacterium]|nr:hypothetical protein [Candidatus Saccharibacteria bacterium]